MTCYEVCSRIDAFIDGELSELEAADIRLHLESCSECREEHETTLRLKVLLAGAKSPEPGQQYWTATAQNIRARTSVESVAKETPSLRRSSPKRESRAALQRAVLSLAASLAFLLAAIYLGSDRSEDISQIASPDAPVLATAPLSRLIGPSPNPLISEQEQMRLATGIMMMGPPGFLGRFERIPDLTNSIRSE